MACNIVYPSNHAMWHQVSTLQRKLISVFQLYLKGIPQSLIIKVCMASMSTIQGKQRQANGLLHSRADFSNKIIQIILSRHKEGGRIMCIYGSR